MTGPWHPPDDQGYWRAPPPRSSPQPPPVQRLPPEDSDFLLSESRGTRQEVPPEPSEPRPPRPPKPHRRRPLRIPPVVREGTKQGVHRTLDAVERRRLDTVLNGAEVRNVGTEDDPQPALLHRHWVGLLFRLVIAGAAVIASVLIPNVIIALIVLAAAHAGVIFLRRGVATAWAIAIGGSEFLVGWLIDFYLGSPMLRIVLILATLLNCLLTVLAWRVDMELITETRLLIRTQGLLLMKRTVQVPLSAIRIADVTGPFLGLGYVSVDTTSDRDQLLHNFGLVSSPNEWTALVLRELSRPALEKSVAGD